MQTLPRTEADPPLERPAAGSTPRSFDPEALVPGSRLDEFEIVRVLGAGGFGIVYLALDQLLLRYVAIKEFIPTALAGRTPQGGVAVRSADAAETFETALDSFYNEGRLLARFDNPSLVRVFRFWKANGTAYMAMQYYPGQTLKEARAQMPGPPDEAWLRTFVDRLLGALEVLHAQGVYHRDIAPDNILLLPDGQPVILDFGSARRIISDRTQSLTAILKPNYSPVEQYADDAGMRQGAYTDLYALGGTVYFMLCGRDPIPAVMRAVRDSFPVMARSPEQPFGALSSEFLAVIDWMLGVSPDDRPKTVDDVRAALRGETQPPAPAERHGVLIVEPNQVYDPARAMAKTELATPRAGAAPSQPVAPAPMPAVPKPPPRSRKLMLSGLAVGACAALTWALTGTPTLSSAEAQAPRAASAAAATAAAVAVAEPAPATSASAPVATGRATAAMAPASSAPAGEDAPKQPPRAGLTPPPAKVRSPVRAPADPSAVDKTAVAPAPAAPAVAAAWPANTPPPQKSTAALCAGMNLFARASCISRSCESPQLASHPQCIEARRIAEQRQQRMEQ